MFSTIDQFYIKYRILYYTVQIYVHVIIVTSIIILYREKFDDVYLYRIFLVKVAFIQFVFYTDIFTFFFSVYDRVFKSTGYIGHFKKLLYIINRQIATLSIGNWTHVVQVGRFQNFRVIFYEIERLKKNTVKFTTNLFQILSVAINVLILKCGVFFCMSKMIKF